MRLLVSVSSAREALSALQGRADLIDAKDPRIGPLGPVSVETLRKIRSTCAGERPVTAALGDAYDTAAIERLAHTFSDAGAAFVKVGFSGVSSAGRIAALLLAVGRGVKHRGDKAGVVAVAYADAEAAESLAPAALIGIAHTAGAHGLLIDTADKSGPGLRALVAPSTLVAWIEEAHNRGLFVALAGKLAANDLGFVRDAGADIAGVRGAACEGGRTGQVVAERVRWLREQLHGNPWPAPDPREPAPRSRTAAVR